MTGYETEPGVNPNVPGISVLLPAWNEGENLIRLAEAILRLPRVSELIVVDDASSDGTLDLWKKSAVSKNSRAKVIVNQKRLGLACSVLQAARVATGDFLLVRDSDWNHDLATMPLLFAAADEGIDLAVASRFESGARKIGRWNDVLSIVLNRFFRMFCPFIRDWTYGYFLIRRELLAGAPNGWIFRGRGEYSVRLYRWLARTQPGIVPLMVPTLVQPRGAGKSSTKALRHGLAYLTGFFDPVPSEEEKGADLGSALRAWKSRGTGVAACGHSRLGLRSRLALLEKEKAEVRGATLDLGCGNGAFSRLAFPQAQILDGVDLSQDLLREAAATYRAVFEGDLRLGLPPALEGKTYDSILCLELIQYLSWGEIRSLLAAARRIARPGASLLCLFPHRASLWHRIRHALGLGGEDYLSRHDASLVVAAALEAGWQIREGWGCSFGSGAANPVESFQKASLTQAHFLLRFQA